MTESHQELTVEIVYLDDFDGNDDPRVVKVGAKDVRFTWQGIEYRRGVICQGEPDELWSITRLDDDANIRLEIFGRNGDRYQAFDDGADTLPPLERFIFLLPKHPSGFQRGNSNAWRDPELIGHEVVA